MPRGQNNQNTPAPKTDQERILELENFSSRLIESLLEAEKTLSALTKSEVYLLPQGEFLGVKIDA